MTGRRPAYAVVVPTLGRDSLRDLLTDLAGQGEPRPRQVVVIDDRTSPGPPLAVPERLARQVRVRVLPGFGRGPAAARNLGWQVCTEPWVAFLDDDVRLAATWTQDLAADLTGLAEDVAATQAAITVPLPSGRRPTDWERNTAGLEVAKWATADMAFRRSALLHVHGFDERFPRAYREDADLAARLRASGWRLARGTRVTTHPVRSADRRVSARLQRGNADDALLRRVHGRRWRDVTEAGGGRFGRHAATVLAASTLVGGVAGWRLGHGETARSRGTAAAVVGGLAWLGLTTDFALRRIAPGPRTPDEVATMAWTSVVIPPLALWHRTRGWWRHRRAQAWPPPPRAILFDRDDTLVVDVPHNTDPSRVEAMPGAQAAVELARRHDLRLGVVTNQSGVGRGTQTCQSVARVNGAVDRLLGPFDTWQVCHHAPDDGCDCRKPAPGLVRSAARELGVRTRDCVVVGDIGSDLAAARAAGARGVLVPTPRTRPEEVADAPVVADDLLSAVRLALGVGHA